MAGELDYTFPAMGSDVRLLIGRPLHPGAPPAPQAADREREFVLAFAHRLSRFSPDSELSALNRDPHSRVAASASAPSSGERWRVGGEPKRRAG